ncbi:MAG: malto-oligosyltrehalose synthase [Verrucomicrobia bacterium]|nr:malto-oligosyltrehalose synthase [Verrucomicrobiota bacterium]
MAANPRIPTATYRLQYNRNFKFTDALKIIPYLQKLGISDVYSSPFFRSHPGSDHGYDVSNHNEINAGIGTRDDFNTLAGALKERNMGHIADFVPNHMGISDANNEWWMDVLENGPSSTFAPFFDIDWDPIKEALHNKILLPVLGDQYGRVLERGELGLDYREGAFFVTYYDWVFPLNPRTYYFVLQPALRYLANYSDEIMVQELESIITGLEHLPSRTETDPAKVRERAREKEIVKRRIARLCTEYPQVREAIDGAMNQVQGRVGDPHSFDKMDELLDSQAYRLSYWRVAGEEINYRRFFDVNNLAAIRVENPVVFETIHRLVFELLKAGQVTGLRIDHVDGLRYPKAYLRQLQRRMLDIPDSEVVEDSTLRDRGFYLIVEKILSEDEKLRTDWPIHGTTGYDFVTDVTQVLVDSANADHFSRLYREFIDRHVHFESLVFEKKRLVMDVSLSSDIESLGHRMSELAERDRLHRDFTRDSLSVVVRDLIACFPVYRTYIGDDQVVSEADRQVVLRAARAAKRRNPSVDASIFDFLRDLLLLEKFENFDQEARQLQLEFVLKFQQCTGPIMAKGLEDTAFYIYNRLVALNEVGGEPQRFGINPERFHERNRLREINTPHTLTTLTSHDTKRSEDVRARIAVLSELPREWQGWLEDWRKMNFDFKTNVDGELAPSANEEYLLYQTLLGTWPFSAEEINEEYEQRLQQYFLKAIKEAKVNSSWIQPNQDWENASSQFLHRLLQPDHPFRKAVTDVSQLISWHGMLNSLSQTILKLTVPGVPDFYQGTELWDFSLVDPDNRRPVNYAKREEALETIQKRPLQELFGEWQNGYIKLAVVHRLLLFRQKHRSLFQQGNYASLYASGPLANHCLSFARKTANERLLVIVPRLTTRLGKPQESFNWQDTHLLLDERYPALTDALSDRTLKAGAEAVPLEMLADLPFAVFHGSV